MLYTLYIVFTLYIAYAVYNGTLLFTKALLHYLIYLFSEMYDYIYVE